MDPKTVLRQDTLLLYNPKECGERKKVCPFFLLENSRPLSPWGPLDSLSTCLGNDSLMLFGLPSSANLHVEAPTLHMTVFEIGLFKKVIKVK